MARVLHLTAGHPRNDEMAMLEASSLRNGFSFKALPQFWGAERLAKIEKLSLLRAFIESGEVAADRVVLFTDAYDVLVLCHADILEERFLRAGVDIMFSAEANYFPKDGRDPATRALFETFTSKWRYLNSGCYVGYAWAVRELLRHAMSIQTADSCSDQMLTQEFFRYCTESGRVRVGLDTLPAFFGSLNASYNDFALRGAYVYGPDSGLPVPVLHCNGDKDNLRILRGLWTLVDARPDLRILQVGGQHVRYDPVACRLARVGGAFADLVFAVCHANLRLMFFTARSGCLTFAPNGSVKCGRADVRTWETLCARDEPRSMHGLALSAYFAVEPAISPLPTHFPVALLRDPDFPVVIEHARRFARQLAERPGVGIVP